MKALGRAEQQPVYCLCPSCYRAVPLAAKEKYCPNDGTKLLTGCSHCQAPITSPYVRYCTNCGALLSDDRSPSVDGRRTA